MTKLMSLSDMGISILLRVAGFVPHPKFGKFLELEDKKDKIIKAVERKEEHFPELLISYVSTAFLIPKFILEKSRWEFVFALFSIYSHISSPKVIPLLTSKSEMDKKRDAWDYDGRVHTMYVNMLAKTYGWSIKYINNLDVDVALPLVQEIITEEQLDREFQWTMSDRSYSYDYKTKVGKPNPLPRPDFMREAVKEPQRTQIPTSMMPVGGGDMSAIPPELRPR